MSSFLESNVRELFKSGNKVGLAGILILLWSGRQLFRAMELSLHRAWDIPLNRNWLVGNLLAMMLVLLNTAVVLGVGAISIFLTWARHRVESVSLPHLMDEGWTWADAYFFSHIHSWIVVPGAVALMFLMLYMILPSQQVPVAMAIPGALFASAAWKFSSWLYLTYILRFGSQNPLYGTIWSIVGLLVWLYIQASVFMLGAELERSGHIRGKWEEEETLTQDGTAVHPAAKKGVLRVLVVDEPYEIGALFGPDSLEQPLSRILSLPPRTLVFVLHVGDEKTAVASEPLQKSGGVSPQLIGAGPSSFTPR